MPPMPPVPGVVKVLIGGFVDNTHEQNWANILHFNYTGPAPTQANLQTFAGVVESMWTTNMAPECPAPTTLQTVQVTDLSSAMGAGAEILTSVAGTRGDDSGPANAAMLVSYPVPARWRGGHPRSYLYIGGVSDYQGAAEWSNAFQGEGQAHWRAFVGGCEQKGLGTTTLGFLCVVRTHGKFITPNSGPPHYILDTPIVYQLNSQAAVTSLQIASMRTRIGRARRNKAGAIP